MSVTNKLGLQLDPLETFMIEAGAVFVVAGIILVIFLLISRSIKNRRKRVIAALQEAFQPSLNVMLVQNQGQSMPPSALQYHLGELQKAMCQYTIGTQVMIDYLITLKKSLTGTAAVRVEEIYRDLELFRYSEKKMHSRLWKLQAQGIRELATMNHHLPEKLKRLYVRARHETLREEVFMAIARTEQENPLSFLTSYAGKISPWMQLNLHHYLSLMDPRKLPDFSKWFTHADDDVVLFCLQMTAQFRQPGNIPAIAALLQHQNAQIVEASMQALYNLGAIDFLDDVLRAARQHEEKTSISLLTVDFLALLDSNDPRHSNLDHYLTHADFVVRKRAVFHLFHEGPSGQNRINYASQSASLKAMIADAAEPLLH